MPDTGLTEEYLHQLRKDRDKYAAKLTNGHAKTFDQYKEQVGYLNGLQRAESILHDVLKMYTQMQDEKYDD